MCPGSCDEDGLRRRVRFSAIAEDAFFRVLSVVREYFGELVDEATAAAQVATCVRGLQVGGVIATASPYRENMIGDDLTRVGERSPAKPAIRGALERDRAHSPVAAR